MHYFIVNPRSSSDKGMKKWKLIETELKRRHIKYQVFFTKHEGHAVTLSRMISQKYPDSTLIAVGGDGTANEVINGLFDLSTISFGYIPTGSSNDLARSMKIPADPLKALERILTHENTFKMNVGQILSGNERKYFSVSTGIGYDAAICHEALHSKLKRLLNKVKLGKLTYLGIALKQLILLKPTALTLILDDNQAITYKDIFFVALMNHKYEGGGFMFCPKADAADDYLDVCVIEKMSKWKVLRLLPTAFSGNHVNYKGVHIHRCKKAQIKTPLPLAVHTDGESFSLRNDITVSLAEKRISFIN